MQQSPAGMRPPPESLQGVRHMPPTTTDAAAKRPRCQTGGPLIGLDALAQAAECLRTLAHPHRLRIVEMLLGGRYTVGELADACGIPSHMASEHLRLMQRCGFLASEREGRIVYYSVVEPHLTNIMNCIADRFGGKERR
jgi:ArsR family transcriptional regulator, zinc-responsive transcriptional repressor